MVRSYETDKACLIFDDTIIPKPYMDENKIICRRWDHRHGRHEKGINLLTAFYHSQPLDTSEQLRVPVAYECVQKTIHYCDLKTRQEKRQSVVSNNWELSTEEFKTLYKKRWSVEEYHQSLKQNAALAKSRARTATTQSHHLFASLAAYG